jgi:hypothetical protein
MNPVLEEIFTRGGTMSGERFIPLHSNMSPDEGRLIQQAFTAAAPKTSLEIGCAYGVSSLFACETLASLDGAHRHLVIDPFQSTDWEGIGMENLTRAGYIGMVELIEEKSEVALPRLLAAGVRIQAAIIDGWHTFDHTLLDFFYINRMLDLDDTQFPAITQVVRHIMTYPAYRAVGAVGGSETEAPSCMAFQKVAEDERPWNWFAPF